MYCFCHIMFKTLPKLRHRAGGIFAAFPPLPLDKKQRHSFYAQPVSVSAFSLATAQALELCDILLPAWICFKIKLWSVSALQ